MSGPSSFHRSYWRYNSFVRAPKPVVKDRVKAEAIRLETEAVRLATKAQDTRYSHVLRAQWNREAERLVADSRFLRMGCVL